MRASHCVTRRYSIALSDRLVERPLNIGEAATHHSDDCEVAARALQRLRLSRDMKYRARIDEFSGQLLVCAVDELHKPTHERFVGFCCHRSPALFRGDRHRHTQDPY